jgi:hypothetical protein
MSDPKHQLPTLDELCAGITMCEEEILQSSVRFLKANETRCQRIKALQTDIEKVNHFQMLIIVI